MLKPGALAYLEEPLRVFRGAEGSSGGTAQEEQLRHVLARSKPGIEAMVLSTA